MDGNTEPPHPMDAGLGHVVCFGQWSVGRAVYHQLCVCVCVWERERERELCPQASGSFWPPPGEEHEPSSHLPSACTTKWALWSRPTVWNQFQLTCRPTDAYLVLFVLGYGVPFHAALLQQKLVTLEGTDGKKLLLFPKCQDQASRHCSMGNVKRETISTCSHIFF